MPPVVGGVSRCCQEHGSLRALQPPAAVSAAQRLHPRPLLLRGVVRRRRFCLGLVVVVLVAVATFFTSEHVLFLSDHDSLVAMSGTTLDLARRRQQSIIIPIQHRSTSRRPPPNREDVAATAVSLPPPDPPVLRNFPAAKAAAARLSNGTVSSKVVVIQQYRQRLTTWKIRQQQLQQHNRRDHFMKSDNNNNFTHTAVLLLQQRHTANEKCEIRPTTRSLLLSSDAVPSSSSTTALSSSFTYPKDADAHFVDLHIKLAAWGQHDQHIMHGAANYTGPWLENVWIDHFLAKALQEKEEETDHYCLADTFGGYIPLFIPWVDLWVQHKFHYPDGLVDTLLATLRPDVAYVTVSQGDLGLTGYRELPLHQIPNVLVLSAGGYGHVPVPLLKQPETVPSLLLAPADRPYTVVYVGSLKHAPERRMMHDTLLRLSQESSSNNNHNNRHNNISYVHYHGPDWRRVMTTARFNLVPRGYGRTAYHLMEVLQMGLIPIYIYSDEPWVPYRDLLWWFDNDTDDAHDDSTSTTNTKIGYATTVQNLPALLKRLVQLSPAVLVQMEATIVAYRHSHFTYAAVMRQIELFLRPPPTAGSVAASPSSDLRCQRLPKRPR